MTTPQDLQALLDREAIRDSLYRYCRGIDRADEAALRSAYWDDATDCHGAWNGTASGFIEQALPRLRQGGRRVHQITNVLIELHGDVAAVESSFFALQVPAHQPTLETFLCGRYVDRFERRGKEWRVAARTVVYDWLEERQPYIPPKVWTPPESSGGRFANINRPVAGPTHEKALPVGKHPLQLYSLGTPNGVKVTVMLEELLALGHTGAEYDAWLIRINEGEQFGSGFVAANPNSKIPALVDHSGPSRCGSSSPAPSCCTWPKSLAPSCPRRPGAAGRVPVAGCSGRWAVRPSWAAVLGTSMPTRPEKIRYAIDRYAMEVKRQMDVLDRRLAETLHGGRRVHHCRHGHLALVRAAGQGPGSTAQASSCRCTPTPMWCAGPMKSRSARRCGAAAWSTACGASRPASCTSATTPATLTPDPGQAGAHDHAVRLRDRAQPAPRAHPAGRKGRGAPHGPGGPAHR
jgi:hypothetical protein